VNGESDLLEVVAALAAAGRLPGLLNGGEQDGHENGDDGDDDEQLNQREPVAMSKTHFSSFPPKT